MIGGLETWAAGFIASFVAPTGGDGCGGVGAGDSGALNIGAGKISSDGKVFAADTTGAAGTGKTVAGVKSTTSGLSVVLSVLASALSWGSSSEATISSVLVVEPSSVVASSALVPLLPMLALSGASDPDSDVGVRKVCQAQLPTKASSS
jgi:hypothetical protein